MIKSFDYLDALQDIEGEILDALKRVLRSGRLILGPETEAFEEELADALGSKHAISVTSGTTALHLTLWALGIGPGDEVITVSNTCAPTVSAIRLTGATPVFVDVREDDLMMDILAVKPALSPRTRCLLPVHLWGHAVDLAALTELAESASLPLVEDCAQAQGTRYADRHVGTFGTAGCFSFYPTKNLGAYGDGGAIATDDDDLAARLRQMRMYGYNESSVSQVEGMNARIAEMQAAVLRIKLRVFPDWLARRKHVASLYHENIRHELVRLPHESNQYEASYHQFVIRTPHRSAFLEHLRRNQIGFGIHYPVPVHMMPPYKKYGEASGPLPVTEQACEQIVSLPIYETLSDEQVLEVASTINQFDPEGH